MNWIGQQVGGLVDFLFPGACPICLGALTSAAPASSFCTLCTSTITLLPSGRCSRCALPFVASSGSSHYCADCSRKLPAFSAVYAAGLYSGAMKQALQRFKYAGAVDLDQPLAKLLYAQIPPDIDEHVIVPVPLHLSRLRQRSYNQSLLLAKVLAHNLQFCLDQAILKRTVDSHSQQGLDACQRAKNLDNAFVATRRLDGCKVLLVDDVMTTGATVSACTQALKEAGAMYVNIAVIARAPRYGR
jgi:ComF family protein